MIGLMTSSVGGAGEQRVAVGLGAHDRGRRDRAAAATMFSITTWPSGGLTCSAQ